ncbi:hypothetical protein BB560_000901 [Smittium megazygosporum]|uniref:SCA7 domain-containing protein n=1 Tax=Smittium megazygosporum TaxID=133381 RepID=A0A2T9ZJ43_9FUNG|nr:hypothetical protein BB560_000901 [Smittium megazygosporum]
MGSKPKTNGSRPPKKSQPVLSCLDELTSEQINILKRKLSEIGSLEQEVIEKANTKLHTNPGDFNLEALVFQGQDDWKPLLTSVNTIPKTARMSFEALKKAVSEEDKYQSKKNWSSTKGKGTRKDPVAKRLNLYDIKLFGVSPPEQFPLLSFYAGYQSGVTENNILPYRIRYQQLMSNTPLYLTFQKKIDCRISNPKKEDKRSITARTKDKSDLSSAKRNRADDDVENIKGSMAAQSLKSSKKAKTKADAADDGKGKKKKRSAASSKPTPKPKVVEFDLDKQCGVVAPPTNKRCMRSLTCKAHSMAMKRAVRGRSQPFDSLLQAHLAKSRSAKQARTNDIASASKRASSIVSGQASSDIMKLVENMSDSEHEGSDSETESLVRLAAQYNVRPVADKVKFMPRRRRQILRAYDLFSDALCPPSTVSSIPGNYRLKHNLSQKNVSMDSSKSKQGPRSRDSSQSTFDFSSSLRNQGAEYESSAEDKGSSSRDLFCIPLRPKPKNKLAGVNGKFTSVASIATYHANPSIAAMMNTYRMAVGQRNPLSSRPPLTSPVPRISSKK